MNLLNIETQINKVIKECKDKRDKISLKIKKENTNINKNEALIIISYTYQDSKPPLSPYIILNSFLESSDRENGLKISKIFLYFNEIIK